MLGIWLVTGDINKVIGIVSLAPFSSVADYAAHHHPDVHPDGVFLGLERARARPLCRRRELAVAYPRRARHRHRVRLRHLRRDVGRERRRRVGDVARSPCRRCAATAIPTNSRPASIGIGATLDILIPPSIAMVIYGIATQTSIGKLLIAGVVPGIVVGILLARHDLSLGRDQPAARADHLPRAAGGTLGKPDADLAEPAADRAAC